MKVAAICCTYKRPKLLEQAIECYLRQDYPSHLRELVILDDAGQYGPMEGQGWKIISIGQRFRTMGEKRNASAALVSPDVDAYFVWDDDDIYLPWHISASVQALASSDYTIPGAVYVYKATGMQYMPNETHFHGAWAFRRSAFDTVHGYPFIQSGQDKGLLERFISTGLVKADPVLHDPRISYVYRLGTDHRQHLSSLGEGGYELLEREAAPKVTSLHPHLARDWTDLCAAFEKTRKDK